jgi:hypothetical protein
MRRMLASMTLLLRALVIGHVAAAGAAIWLSASGVALWAVLLAGWIGGNLLGLGFAAAGAWLWPAAPARRSSFTATEAEFRLWDEDLVLERIDADLRHDPAAAAAPAAAAEPTPLRETG